MISQNTLDRIKDRSIEQVVQHYIELKPKGSLFSACCPFHDEKTPSFIVTPKKNSYKCFGCGVHGDAIQFVSELQKLSFVDTLKEIAQKFNIPIEYEFDKDDVDHKKKLQSRETLYSLNVAAAREFQKQLFKRDPQHVVTDIFKRHFDLDSLQFWQIGYAPDEYDFLSKLFIEQGKSQEAISTGLINSKSGKHYDFFRDRLMIPIVNERGRIVSFTGRGYNPKYGKYINGPETEIYNKSNTLFGLYQNQQSIRKAGFALLCEGPIDVISLHRVGIELGVASCGTAFTDLQAKVLKRYTEYVCLFFDRDKAGIAASIKTLLILLKHDFAVDIALPLHGEDPDSMSRKYVLQDFIDEKRDAVIHVCSEILDSETKISMKDQAIDKVCDILSCIPKCFKKDQYVDILVKSHKKSYGFTKKDLNDRIFTIQQKRINAEAIRLDRATGGRSKLAKNQTEDILNFGFYENENFGPEYGYYFSSSTGEEQKSNFIMKAMFLIKDIENPKRIFEITNENKYRKIVEFSVDDMVSLNKFKIKLEGLGKFLFDGGIGHMNRLKHKLFAQEKQCREIKVPGWQREGFYAFSNGIFNGQFKEIDEYGITEYKGKHYFIPALSKIYADSEESYDHQKRFKFIPGDTGFGQWSKLIYEVHGDINGSMGILFFVASLFRDFIFHRLSFFPHLFLFGPPGTGKSQLAESLISMFGDRQDKLNLTATTKNGFYRKLGQFSNALCWADEYKNDISPELVESLKSVYDGTPYTKGVKSQDTQTATIPVKSACIISGQQLPTQDVALFTRSILGVFKERDFNVVAFDELKELEMKGLTSVTIQILQYREKFEQSFNQEFDKRYTELKKLLRRQYPAIKFDDRIIKNYLILLTTYLIFKEELKFPFTEKQAIKIFMETISSQAVMLGGSNDISQFWEIIESLSITGLIRENEHYKLDKHDGEDMLFIRFTHVHGLYMKEYRQQNGRPGLGKASLKSYLKGAAEWRGSINNTRFNDFISGSAYLFNYEVIQSVYNINLFKDDALPESELTQSKQTALNY